jgi:hypothetical protein
MTVGANTSTGTVTTPGFSTAFCNNLVVVNIITSAASVTNVTDAQGHLTFTKRVAATGGGNDIEEWTAPLSGAALSGDAITVTVASASFTSVYVNSISGYKTSAPFDTNAAIPNTQTTAGVSCTWTTSNANDILVGFSNKNNLVPDAGWTLLSDGNNGGWFDFGELQSVAATQAGTTAASVVGQCIADAIQKGP